MTEDIREKYSDTRRDDSAASGPRIFAIDSGSPVSSVALTWDGELLTQEFSVGDSSKRLLPKLDEMLAQAGGRLDQLDGLVGLRGPGSFTGLRVGLATLLGLHQALGIRAATATTFEALAWQARRFAGSQGPIIATVDALRGERFVQHFDSRTLEPLGEPQIRPDAEIARLEAGSVIGFGLASVRDTAGSREKSAGRAGLRLLEAQPLAGELAAIAVEAGFVWDASSLTRPLYLRPPAATAANAGP